LKFGTSEDRKILNPEKYFKNCTPAQEEAKPAREPPKSG
jgi:hypothetical protein